MPSTDEPDVTPAQDAPSDDLEALRAEVASLREANDALVAEVARWRARTVDQWSHAVAATAASSPGAVAELDAMRRSVSWRVTRPLRAVRRIQIERFGAR